MVLGLSNVTSGGALTSSKNTTAMNRNSETSSSQSCRHNSLPSIVLSKLSKSEGKNKHSRSSSNTIFEMKSYTSREDATINKMVTGANNASCICTRKIISTQTMLLDENDNLSRTQSAEKSEIKYTQKDRFHKNDHENTVLFINKNTLQRDGCEENLSMKSKRLPKPSDKRRNKLRVEVGNFLLNEVIKRHLY